MIEKLIKVKNDGKFLVATMPNGDVIPCQVELILNNNVRHGEMTEVTVTLIALIPTAELSLMPDVKEKEDENRTD